MAQRSNKTALILLIILIPVTIYLLSFSSIVFSERFYKRHISREDLPFAMEMVNYLQDREGKEGSYLYIPDSLPETEGLSQKERQHMLDVKILISRIYSIMAVLMILVSVLLYCSRKKMDRVFVYGGVAAVVVPAVLYLAPFEPLFMSFHSLFFRPGTWILAYDSVVANTFTVSFFQSALYSILIRGFVTGWLLILAGILLYKKR